MEIETGNIERDVGNGEINKIYSHALLLFKLKTDDRDPRQHFWFVLVKRHGTPGRHSACNRTN